MAQSISGRLGTIEPGPQQRALQARMATGHPPRTDGDQMDQEPEHENEGQAVEANAETPTLHNLARVIRSSLAEQQQGGKEPAERESNVDFSAAMDNVRRVSEALRAAEQRSNDLQAGLQALTERARREIGGAEERVRAANERADAAEERARQAEERLAQMMDLIQREFAAALGGQAPAQAASAA
jgi:DNA repair exonuclease SbcCD ATPase subunit